MTGQANVMPLVFRADIEGLRAVAILLVVAAHARIPGMEGGFVGVDVFFVLSGFLITGLLANELDRTGRINLPDFYARRTRRLFPALLAMLVVTSLFAGLLMAPLQQPAQAAAAGSAALWLSNVYFAATGFDYFGMQADENLFLHTWSLGVEEQFYIAWPATMLFLLGAWRWQGGHFNRAHLRFGLWAIGLASLVACILLSGSHQKLAFYLTPFRAWEFALGGLLALRGVRAPGNGTAAPARPQFGRVVTGALGLAAIVAAAVFLEKAMPYPSAWALLPALGTAAIIHAGTDAGRNPVSAFLAIAPLRAVGRLSYSWYLWHWPVLILGGMFLPITSIANALILAFASLGVAAIFYTVIEAPVRRSLVVASHPGWTIGASLALLITTWVGASLWADASTRWSEQGAQREYQLVRGNTSDLYTRGCDEWFHSDRVNPCHFGKPDAPKTAVLIGDSIGAQWFPALQSIYTRDGWKLTVITKSACPMVDVPYFYQAIGRPYTECERWRDEAIALVAAMQPDIVILGSSDAYPFSRSQWVEGTAAVLARLHAKTARIVIVRATPALPFDGPACLSGKSWRPALFEAFTPCTAHAAQHQNDDVHVWLGDAAHRFTNVEVVDLNGLACPNHTCAAEVDGRVAFRDTRHLAAAFVASLAPDVAARLER